jgi:hypothetical protein
VFFDAFDPAISSRLRGAQYKVTVVISTRQPLMDSMSSGLNPWRIIQYRQTANRRHSDLGDLPSSSHHQVKVSATPFRKTAQSNLRLHPQETQHRTAVFRDVT